MPRFINVTLGCDWEGCTNIGSEDEGTVFEKTLSVDGKPARRFLICKDHDEELDEIITPLLAAGTKVENGNSRKTATINPEDHLECLECGRTDIKNKAGMAQHQLRTHKQTLAEYEAKHDID